MQGMMSDDPPATAAAVVTEVKARQGEWGLEDVEVAKVREAGKGGV